MLADENMISMSVSILELSTTGEKGGGEIGVEGGKYNFTVGRIWSAIFVGQGGRLSRDFPDVHS